MKAVKAILAILVLALIAKWVGYEIGTSTAKREIQEEAFANNFPAGFFKANWLSSVDDVKRIHPNAVQAAPDHLTDYDVFDGRDAKVSYFFKSDALVLFVITFKEPVSPESYDDTQAKLIKDYGAMPNPAPTGSCKLSSKKKTERFELEHCFREAGAAPVEQILIFRTPGSGSND